MDSNMRNSARSASFGLGRRLALVAGLALTLAPAAAQTKSSITVHRQPSNGSSSAGTSGQTSAPATAQPVRRSTGSPQRDTLLRMMRTVTLEFNATRMQEVVEFILTATGVDAEPMWLDDQESVGLDPDEEITLKATGVTYLTLLEKVLEKAGRTAGFAGGNTWQLSETGTLQFGPRERLNRFKRVEIYDIRDLLLVLPDYTEAPEFDLNSVLQSSQGGGGQSPFQQNQQENDEDRLTLEQRAERVTDLIIQLVEPDQWTENAGNGGSIRYFQGTLIVNAADYMHRALNGYPYWPSESTSVTRVAGRRYVTLSPDASNSQLEGFGTAEVTAVVGGQLIRSGDSGGGGSLPPANQPGGRTPPPKR
ncbi:MAG: hypothetical protein SFZ23_00695 [Planctomycetota bacterium]|nr:hypothetical protein [Planctomycetota bacterium]